MKLKDDQGGIAAVFVDEDFDVRLLAARAPGQAEIVGHEEKPRTQATRPLVQFTPAPALALAPPADDGQRRYRLGTVTVR